MEVCLQDHGHRSSIKGEYWEALHASEGLELEVTDAASKSDRARIVISMV